MAVWALTNGLLTLLALAFIKANGRSPHRLRFLVCLGALGAWLIPWQWFSGTLATVLSLHRHRTLHGLFPRGLVPHGLFNEQGRLDGIQVLVINGDGFMDAGAETWISGLALAFIAACLSGLVLFVVRLAKHWRELRELARGSREGKPLWRRCGMKAVAPLAIQHRIPGAFTSGVLNPRIWIHADLVYSPNLKAMLLHEATHIAHRDNLYLTVATLVESLFWWNPLVRMLGKKLRRLQELSCDESCAAQLPAYQGMLAELMLENHRSDAGRSPGLIATNVFDTPNANVERIRILERKYPMKPRHVLATAVLLGATFFLIGAVTADLETTAGIIHRIHGIRLSDTGVIRTHSIQGDNFILQQAINLIAEQPHCHIFQNGDSPVVDHCG